MTRHQRIERALSAYVDGELRGRQTGRLEAHLAECDDCRVRLRDLERLRGLLRQGLDDPGLAFSPLLWLGVRARIERGQPEGKVQAWVRRIREAGWERPTRAVAGAILATILVVAATYLFWGTTPGTAPGKSVALTPGQAEVMVEAVEPEPGYRAMVFTTSGRGCKVIWVVARGGM